MNIVSEREKHFIDVAKNLLSKKDKTKCNIECVLNAANSNINDYNHSQWTTNSAKHVSDYIDVAAIVIQWFLDNHTQSFRSSVYESNAKEINKESEPKGALVIGNLENELWIPSDRVLSAHKFSQSGCDSIYGRHIDGDIGIRVRLLADILPFSEFVRIFFKKRVPARFNGEQYSAFCSEYNVFYLENYSVKNQMKKEESKYVEMYVILSKVHMSNMNDHNS